MRSDQVLLLFWFAMETCFVQLIPQFWLARIEQTNNWLAEYITLVLHFTIIHQQNALSQAALLIVSIHPVQSNGPFAKRGSEYRSSQQRTVSPAISVDSLNFCCVHCFFWVYTPIKSIVGMQTPIWWTISTWVMWCDFITSCNVLVSDWVADVSPQPVPPFCNMLNVAGS